MSVFSYDDVLIYERAHKGVLMSMMLALLLAAQAENKAADLARELAGENRSDLAWVEKRVKEWQPRPEERKLDRIGWAKDIRDALRLAQEHKRPVFLFTLDGKMGLGRC